MADLQQTHLKDLTPDQLDPRPDTVVIDLSFISLDHVWPRLMEWVAPKDGAWPWSSPNSRWGRNTSAATASSGIPTSGERPFAIACAGRSRRLPVLRPHRLAHRGRKRQPRIPAALLVGRPGLNLYFAERFPNQDGVQFPLPERVRPDFPILVRSVHGKPLVYLDNAASAQKPLAVIEGQKEYLANYHANIHRGAHHLAQLATEAYEGARRKIANHIGAKTTEEIIFTAGSTDAVNLVAQSWGRANLSAGDTVLVTRMEHHANIVPWQMVCEEKGAEVMPVDVREDGTLDLEDFARKLERHQPKLVGVVHASNTLGTINPVTDLCRGTGRRR